MEIKNLKDNGFWLTLSAHDPQISMDLKQLNELVREKDDCYVIIDFSYAEIINSSNISNLLILRSFLEEKGRELILYNVQNITKCIFVVAGIAEAFVFMDEDADIRQAIQSTC